MKNRTDLGKNGGKRCGSVPAQFPGPIVLLVNLQQLAIVRL